MPGYLLIIHVSWRCVILLKNDMQEIIHINAGSLVQVVFGLDKMSKGLCISE